VPLFELTSKAESNGQRNDATDEAGEGVVGPSCREP
jgi:hypothetical protein